MKKTVLVLYYHFILHSSLVSVMGEKKCSNHIKKIQKSHRTWCYNSWHLICSIRKHWKLSGDAIKHVLLWKHIQPVVLFTELVAGRNSGSWLAHQVGVYLHHIFLDNVRCQCLPSWHCVWLIFTDGCMDFCRVWAMTAVAFQTLSAVFTECTPSITMSAEEENANVCLMRQRSHVWVWRPFPAVINLSVATRYP